MGEYRPHVLGGLTIAGLGVIDVEQLAHDCGTPVVAVHRHDPQSDRLGQALCAAGLADRIAIVERAPVAWPLAPGLFASHAGTTRERAAGIVSAACGKSQLPEALRVAHLVASALVLGQSRGRA